MRNISPDFLAKATTARQCVALAEWLTLVLPYSDSQWSDLEMCDITSSPDDCADNNGGQSVYLWMCEESGLVVVLESTDCYYINVSVRDAGTTLRSVIEGWDCEAWGDEPSMLADMGFDPELIEAEESAGACRVWCEPNYYQGTCNAPRAGWERDDRGDILEFSSIATAQNWVAETEEGSHCYRSESDPRGCYVLAHGEAGRPTYTIVNT